jgi:hypothetical protein
MPDYVEDAETQNGEWKGTAAFDGPQFGVADDVFDLDRKRFGRVIGFSIFGGGEAQVGLSMSATAYVLSAGLADKSADELLAAARRGEEIRVVQVHGVKATAGDVLSKFKRFEIVALPSWVIDEDIRLRIDSTVELAWEEEEERERRDEENER